MQMSVLDFVCAWGERNAFSAEVLRLTVWPTTDMFADVDREKSISVEIPP